MTTTPATSPSMRKFASVVGRKGKAQRVARDAHVEVRLIYRLCRVSGRVQGVYYRASARSQARELGITGYAANLSDGRVEVLACGEPEAVAAFIDWLKIGPPAASVTGVEVLEHRADVAPTRFETR